MAADAGEIKADRLLERFAVSGDIHTIRLEEANLYDVIAKLAA